MKMFIATCGPPPPFVFPHLCPTPAGRNAKRETLPIGLCQSLCLLSHGSHEIGSTSCQKQLFCFILKIFLVNAVTPVHIPHIFCWYLDSEGVEPIYVHVCWL